jgi:hypothetical protein
MMSGSPKYSYDIWTNSSNVTMVDRRLKVFRPSDLKNSSNTTMPEKAQIYLGPDFYFALYPSDLGYAYKQSLIDGKKTVIQGFNVKEYDN